ncbi:transcriptional regulator [Vibrio phage pVa-21]|nr:transcriptional regulator [Vibrio phage pVa-21]
MSDEVVKRSYPERELTVSDMVRIMATLRSSELTLPAMLTMTIVNENASARFPMVYAGEIECVYRSIIANKEHILNTVIAALPEDTNDWSYSAISRHLRVLAKKGFLNRQRDGRYVGYGMTDQGVELLVKLFGPQMELSPKKNKAKKTKKEEK